MSEEISPELRRKIHESGKALVYSVIPLMAPRAPITPRQWAAKYRRIGQGASPLAKENDIRYDENIMPWCQEPMDAAIDPVVSTVVLQFAAAMGKTDGVVTNLIGWAIAESPRNIMALYPNENAIEKWSRDVLQKTIDATPILKELVTEKKGRESGNSINFKSFAGGSIYATSAGSVSNFRGPRVGLAYIGEADGLPKSVGREGDPASLLFRRCEGYDDAIQIIESTPTIKGKSEIEAWYLQSDQRKWHIPCRKCGVYFVAEWRHVIWQKGKPETAVLRCDCGADHNEEQRLRIVRLGEWRPTAPFDRIRGYKINSINSTLPPKKGHISKLHQYAAEWMALKGVENETLKRRAFINLVLGECDEEEINTDPPMDHDAIYERRETYASAVPEPVRAITAGIDVQGNRVEIVFIGWGRDEQAWILEHQIVNGSPQGGATWQGLEAALLRRWKHPSGVHLETSVAMIDRGHSPHDVDAFAARPLVVGRCYTAKGASEAGLPIIGKIKVIGRGGANYFRLGTEAAKDYIFSRLRLEPANGIYPPGYIHFPDNIDPKFVQQVTSETVKVKYERGKQTRRYVKINENAPNEGLDLLVYALAAFRLRAPWDWDALDASISAAPVAPVVAAYQADSGNFATGGRSW